VYPWIGIQFGFMLHLIEIQFGYGCRFMGRWRFTGVVVLILLLSAASHGRGSSM
jgi:hypothetical protein